MRWAFSGWVKNCSSRNGKRLSNGTFVPLLLLLLLLFATCQTISCVQVVPHLGYDTTQKSSGL